MWTCHGWAFKKVRPSLLRSSVMHTNHQLHGMAMPHHQNEHLPVLNVTLVCVERPRSNGSTSNPKLPCEREVFNNIHRNRKSARDRPGLTLFSAISITVKLYPQTSTMRLMPPSLSSLRNVDLRPVFSRQQFPDPLLDILLV